MSLLRTLSSNFIRFNLIVKHSKEIYRNARLYSVNERLSPYVSHPYSYAFGRSVNQLQYITIGELLESRANSEKESSLTAVVSCDEDIVKTFVQLDADVNKLVKSLIDLGLQRGDVIGVWSCNSYAWITIQYACARLGIILCTLNPFYRSVELNFALRKGQIKALFIPGINSKQEVVNKYHEVLLETIRLGNDQSISDDPLIVKHLITMDGDNNFNIDGIKKYTLNDLISNDGNYPKSYAEQVCADDPAIIMFTSGTTGKPKGAVLSHFTLGNNALLCAKSFGFKHNEQIIICVPLPLFHSFAAVLGGITMTASPATIVLSGFKYDVKSIVNAIVNYNCTHIMVTPTMIIDILNYIEKRQIKLNSLRGTLIGGAPVPVEVAQRISRVIPSCDDVRIGYGATELGPCTTACHRTDSPVERLETVGSPLDLVEVKIVNPQTGRITKIGEQGELLSRGHNVMIGYWRDENKTKEAIDDANWYKSGDLAVMDEKGYVKIIGRTKELIIRGGENVYPREIEELLHSHPEILDVYVIGVPDERLGEEVCAWIKLRNKDVNVNVEQIKEFCKEKISYFKIPRYILFVDEFPLTSTGKAKKFIMREKSCEILGLKELR